MRSGEPRGKPSAFHQKIFLVLFQILFIYRLALFGGCSGFLQTMVVSQVSPDIKTVTTLLDVIEPKQEAEEELMNECSKHNITLDVDFFNLLIRKRCLSMNYVAAKDVMKLIESHQLKPNMMTYGVLALACSSLDDTKTFLGNLNKNGINVNIEVIGALMRNACVNFNIPTIRHLLRLMEREKIQPNSKLLEHLNRFQQNTVKELTAKKSGRHVHSVLLKDGFEEDYHRLLDELNRSEILKENVSEVHPWEQFRRQK